MYIEALPSGEWACVTTAYTEIHTHLGSFPVEKDLAPLQLRVSNIGGFQFAGPALGKPLVSVWKNGWSTTPPPPYGLSTAIYDAQGILRIADVDTAIRDNLGVLGWRYVDPVTGALVSGASTYYDPATGLCEWSDIGDGVRVGQSVSKAAVVYFDGALHLLWNEGKARWIRPRRDGENVAIAWVVEDGQPSEIRWTTMAELRALPVYAEATPPDLPEIEPFTHPCYVGFSWVPADHYAPGNCQVLTTMAGEPAQDWRQMADPTRPVFAGGADIALARPPQLLGQIGTVEGAGPGYDYANSAAFRQFLGECEINGTRPTFADDGEPLAFPQAVLDRLPTWGLPCAECYPVHGEGPGQTVSRLDAKVFDLLARWPHDMAVVVPVYTQQGFWQKDSVYAIATRVTAWSDAAGGRLKLVWVFPRERGGAGGPLEDPDMMALGELYVAADGAAGIPVLRPIGEPTPEPAPPEPPTPIPPFPGDPMLPIVTSFIDPQETMYLVSSVKSSSAPGKSVLVLANGNVLSLQEDGTFAERPPNSDGPFEQCNVSGQTATYLYLWNGNLRGPKTVSFAVTSGPAQ